MTPRVGFGKLALLCWLVVVLAVCVRVCLKPGQGSVVPVFADAARAWLDGEDVYLQQGSPFRYSPIVAIIFAPITLISGAFQEIAWRALNLTVFALALWHFGKFDRGWGLNNTAKLFLLALPLAVGSLNNGQSNLLTLGLLLLAHVGCQGGRFTRAAAYLTIAVCFKLYPISWALLLVVLHPRQLSWRFAIGLCLAALLPFALRSSHYVERQYLLWAQDLLADNRQAMPMENWYRDIRLLLRQLGITMSPPHYLLAELASGTAIACWVSRSRSHDDIFVLASIWMTLLGPATESCSYVYLAPALGTFLIGLGKSVSPDGRSLLAWLSYGVFVATAISVWFPGARQSWHVLGPHAAAALFFLAAWCLSRRSRETFEQAEGESSDPCLTGVNGDYQIEAQGEEPDKAAASLPCGIGKR